MRIQHLIVCIVIYLLDCHRVLTEIPHCAFEDTVNITASQKFPNGTYSYQNVLVPKHLIGNYTYIERYNGYRRTVKKHLRGCVCQLKPCVKFCCHVKGRLYRSKESSTLQCRPRLLKEIKYSPYLNITLNNGHKRKMDLLTDFAVQQGIPCDVGNPSRDRWELTEEGKLLQISQHQSLTTRDYCLFPYYINETKSYELNALKCPMEVLMPLSIKVNTMLLLISEPFLYATILIYWCTGNLKSLNGKCIVCYIFALANGTMLIVIVNLQVTVYDDITCAVIGFVAYYFLTAVFFWLNVICFDLWQNVCFITKFKNKTNISEHKRFIYYSLYAWGLPAVMTIIIVCIQHSSIPDKLKPGIGTTVCWLKTDDWSAMLYFHGPFLILIVFNIVIFYMIIKHVFSVRSHLQMVTLAEDRINHLRVLQDNIWQFLRLFFIMGIYWLVEIFAYLLDNLRNYKVLFTVINAFTASQGIILFILLGMTKKNRKIVKKAIKDIFSKLRFPRPKART